jgi:hypothetical protein
LEETPDGVKDHAVETGVVDIQDRRRVEGFGVDARKELDSKAVDWDM